VNAEIEETVLQAFIVPGKREQYVSRFALAKARQKFMNSHLFHMRDLDPRFAVRVDPVDQQAERIYELLRERGAPEGCYVISGSSERDGTEADLREALNEVVAGFD
jgi:hypothetical protein